MIAYFLSAFAVFAALGGIFVEDAHNGLFAKVVLASVELVAIGCIIAIVSIGRFSLWHERWLDYRALAERLRHARFLSFVSEFGLIHPSSAGSDDPQVSWIVWYLRATLRQIGLPIGVLDGTYRWRLLNATLTNEIEEQKEYHLETRYSMGTLDHLLHKMGAVCFVLTFIVLVLTLVGYSVEYELTSTDAVSSLGWLETLLKKLKPWEILCTAGLPALGAALAGIRVQGDFARSHERSSYMINALGRLEDDYITAQKREITLNETAEILISTARVMSEDIAAWQELYGRKRLSLPA